jgi:hypothetical protein
MGWAASCPSNRPPVFFLAYPESQQPKAWELIAWAGRQYGNIAWQNSRLLQPFE